MWLPEPSRRYFDTGKTSERAATYYYRDQEWYQEAEHEMVAQYHRSRARVDGNLVDFARD